jgi:pimeloyl-ACP methyl ester carboxylesterase
MDTWKASSPRPPRALASWIESAGQKVEYRSFPQMGHAMHQQDPKLFAATVIEWADSLLAQRAV